MNRSSSIFVVMFCFACGASTTGDDDTTVTDRDAGTTTMRDAGFQTTRDGGPGAVRDAGPVARDGGAIDPFSTDRTKFFGDARCSGTPFMLCDDFEDVAAGGPPDPGRWQLSDPRIEVATDFTARGSKALHVVTQSTEALHFIRTDQIAPALAQRMWGRLFFRVEGSRPGAFNHWTVVEATGVVPEGGTARIRYGGIQFPGGVNHYLFNYDIWGGRPAGFHEVGASNNDDIADATWHCIEWMFDVDAREARFFIDAVESTDLGAKDRIEDIDLTFPSMDGLNIGWAIYQDIGADTWDVWIDAVAVDAERIGCVR